jgi:hypothetical protein
LFLSVSQLEDEHQQPVKRWGVISYRRFPLSLDKNSSEKKIIEYHYQTQINQQYLPSQSTIPAYLRTRK